MEQRKKQGAVIGYHHGRLNALPALFRYPEKMNLIQMMTLYLMGNPKERVIALRYCRAPDVTHFDKGGQRLARMHRVMKVVKHFGKKRKVWQPRGNGQNYWNGKTVTKLWDEVWVDLRRYLLTVTETGDGKPDSFHKTRSSAFTYRTCYDKFDRAGLFKELGI
jgi:hypothetical protein